MPACAFGSHLQVAFGHNLGSVSQGQVQTPNGIYKIIKIQSETSS